MESHFYFIGTNIWVNKASVSWILNYITLNLTFLCVTHTSTHTKAIWRKPQRGKTSICSGKSTEEYPIAPSNWNPILSSHSVFNNKKIRMVCMNNIFLSLLTQALCQMSMIYYLIFTTIPPISQRRKPRHRDIKQHDQGLRDLKWKIWDFTLGMSVSEPINSNYLAVLVPSPSAQIWWTVGK